MASGRSTSLRIALLVLTVLVAPADAQLNLNFYATSCPNATSTVSSVIRSWVSTDRSLAPALLRLHFHDCFVRGCEASVLLDSTLAVSGEKDAFGNVNSLRGFDVIDDVKSKLEAICPGIVSCADILALAARDAIIAMGGTNWTVPLGRRDGVQSFASEANAQLPPPFADFNLLVSLFSAKGFSVREMVVLSGSHTVGLAHCSNIESRLYNFSATSPTDPSMDPNFAISLKNQCKFGDKVTKVKLDQSKTVDSWDINYFSNVLHGRGLLTSDSSLRTTSAGKTVLQAMNRANSPFNSEFGAAMVKMGNLGVLTGVAGTVRKSCHVAF